MPQTDRTRALSLDEARRIALAAQGFGRPRPRTKITVRHVARTIRRLGVLQLDYVNVLVPAHYQVLFSRLGPYDRSRFDDAVYRRREFTEQWARQASVVPVESWPLLRFRREAFRVRPHGFEKFMERHRDYADWVLDEVRSRGPLAAADIAAPEGVPRKIPGSTWIGTVPNGVLEAHFARGALAVADRLPNFVQVFDLAERLIPPEHFHRRVSDEDGQRGLMLIAARAHGVATAGDLADCYTMPMADARPRIAELVDAGELREVRVEGWREPALLHPKAALPRRIDAAALLSPWDPVVCHRPRAERLFGFDYKVEIFVPRAKRKWGYYVLPFLLGDRLVARVDLKAERKARRLDVLAAYIEPDAKPGVVAPALAEELRTMARWLELDHVKVSRRGGFASALGRAVRG